LVSLVNRLAYHEELVSAGEEFIGQNFGGVHGKARHFVLLLVFLLFLDQQYVSFLVLYMEMGIVRKRLLKKKIYICKLFLELFDGVNETRFGWFFQVY